MAVEPPSTPLRILLTEDHPDTAKVMRMLLEKSGFVVQTAASIEESLRLADSQRFDLLICDMRLPDGTGFELTRELQKRRNLKSICLSGNPISADNESEYRATFTAWLVKPVDIDELLATIQRVVTQ